MIYTEIKINDCQIFVSLVWRQKYFESAFSDGCRELLAFMCCQKSHLLLMRGTEGGSPGEKGRRREKGGRETGFPRWRKSGGIEKTFATFRYICKRNGTKRREPPRKGGGKREKKVRKARSSDPPVSSAPKYWFAHRHYSVVYFA